MISTDDGYHRRAMDQVRAAWEELQQHSGGGFAMLAAYTELQKALALHHIADALTLIGNQLGHLECVPGVLADMTVAVEGLGVAIEGLAKKAPGLPSIYVQD